MAFRINISERSGKTFHLESGSEELMGKKLHEKVLGKDVSPELSGYEFEITGASDKAGFTAMENVEGFGLRKVLLGYGKGMKKRSRKEGKKIRGNLKPEGLRLRKTVRGNTISEDIAQVNLKVLQEGDKKLSEIFPEQNRKKQEEKNPEAEKAAVQA